MLYVMLSSKKESHGKKIKTPKKKKGVLGQVLTQFLKKLGPGLSPQLYTHRTLLRPAYVFGVWLIYILILKILGGEISARNSDPMPKASVTYSLGDRADMAGPSHAMSSYLV